MLSITKILPPYTVCKYIQHTINNSEMQATIYCWILF